MMYSINDILTINKDKAVEFVLWYNNIYTKIPIKAYLNMEDDYKIFIILIYLEEVKGINVVCDNYSFLISYSMRYITDEVKQYVKDNGTNVLKEITYKSKDPIEVIYRRAIGYVFSNYI